ncbi:hypothetical protein CQ13_09485 [Bradyrhizobium retamae]|uniref:Uncharacterized protein n=2 Tax=Bradyrhizobium retamae TaxID=1300035 RepID=A0A0R3MM68_9BRAD|nr:hypothetical protein CQ13_09485 [Bradyrhizobium retamae]
MAKEKRQPASDDFDILQDTPPKFNLLPKLAKVTRCGSGHYATANRILKATKRRTNRIIHLGTYAKTMATTYLNPVLINKRIALPSRGTSGFVQNTK